MSTVPIPDEARWAAAEAFCEARSYAPVALSNALDVAAPFIARAAQVQVLREMADRLGAYESAQEAEDFLNEEADRLEGQN